jgi:hypothetical protein
MNHSYYQKWQFYIQISRTYTNVQIKVNIPFLYLILFRSVWLSVFWQRFIVNHCVWYFLDISLCQHRLFFKFHWHFLDFCDVGPKWFLAKSHCAYCSSFCVIVLSEEFHKMFFFLNSFKLKYIFVLKINYLMLTRIISVVIFHSSEMKSWTESDWIIRVTYSRFFSNFLGILRWVPNDALQIFKRFSYIGAPLSNTL